MVLGLAAIWRSVCISQMNRINSHHDDSTINIVIGISIKEAFLGGYIVAQPVEYH